VPQSYHPSISLSSESKPTSLILSATMCDRVGERIRYLEVGSLCRGLVIEPDVIGRKAFRAQGAEKAGAVQRCLADMSYG
jgi:hypothetical protein